MTATNPNEQTALTVVQPQGFDLSPRNFEEAWRMAEIMADSGMVPKDFINKPGNCLIAIQWGAEVGLKAMQAVQNIAVINGRPSLWGDAALALVRTSPLCKYVIESDDGHTATCRTWRHGEPQEQVRTFSMDDAKTAGLLGKQGPWTNYPKRMRQMRARAFLLRDVYTDVLKGLHMAEEAMDAPPPERYMGPADIVQPTAGAAAPPPPAAKPPYTDEEFNAALPTWQKAVNKGKSPSEVVTTIDNNAPFELTEKQKAVVLSLKKQDPAAPDANAVARQIAAATDREQLALAGDLIRLVPDKAVRDELQAKYDERETALKG